MSAIRDRVLGLAGSCTSFRGLVERLSSENVDPCTAMSVVAHCTAVRIASNLGASVPQGLLAPAITEPHGGSNIQNVTTSARMTPRGWVVDGVKWFVTNGLYADYFLVYLRANDEPAVALVGRNARGLKIEPMKLSAYTCSGIAKVYLRNAEARVMGKTGREAYRSTLRGIAEARVLLAALAVGLGKTVVSYAVEWAKGRGITGLQAVTHRLARAYAILKTAENYVYTIAGLIDEGKLEDWTAASIAKYVAVEAAIEAVTAARRTMAGHAFVDEKLQSLQQHIEALEPAEGTQDIQLEIIARRLFH